MNNPYQTLGVDRNSTADDIKRAYRRLASQHHPDKGGDKARFQEIQQAYEALTNPAGQPQAGNPFAGMGGANFNFESIFDVFGARFNHMHQPRMQQIRVSLWIQLIDVAVGGKKTVSIGTHQGNMTVEIDIPPGIQDGETVQYPNLGQQGFELLITFRIHPDPRYQRIDSNLVCEHQATIWDLILGGETTVRDIHNNNLSLAIPSRTQPGTTFRLRGRGLPQRGGGQGDLLVRVQANIPEHIDQAILDAIAQHR
jgi:curved DNA-binding protein